MVKPNQTGNGSRKTQACLKRNRWLRATHLIVTILALLIYNTPSLGTQSKYEPNELILKYEGFKAKPYKCAGGEWTVGYGTQTTDRTTTITEAEALVLMEAHLDKYVRPHLPKYPFGKKQTAALESLVYNIGASKWNKSTLKKCVLSNDTACIEREWNRWVYVDSKPNQWQIKRRKAELAYFLGDPTEVLE